MGNQRAYGEDLKHDLFKGIIFLFFFSNESEMRPKLKDKKLESTLAFYTVGFFK